MNPSVVLIAHTPDPIRVMALSARLCYTQGMGIEALNKSLTDEQCERLVRKIIGNKHHGVLEHAIFTFGVEGVSRDFSHQMVRHRNTSYDQQSLHYTLAPDGFEMAQPPGLHAGEQKEWNKAKASAWKLYSELVKRGVPREEARHILPSGIQTRLIMTANLRQWIAFVKIRACIVNCHEITVVSHKIKGILEQHIPFLKEELGPTCWTEGVCYEGKKYCNAPWRVPCKVKGDGLDVTFETREEANAGLTTHTQKV